jgi:PmbA protein
VVSVYFGQRTGSASTSDFNDVAIKDTVRAACSIAKYTAEDECNGLADPALLATEFPDLDLYHPWVLDVEHAIERALECESTARGADPRIKNSEGASVSTQERLEVYVNSNGFVGSVEVSRHGGSCAVVGETENGMQRDYWYTSARDVDDLESAQAVGEKAAQRTLRRLDARKIKTCQAPVVYEAPIASSVLSHFIGAIRGGSLYRKASFLVDHLGKQIFPEWVRIREQPLLAKAMGSAAFDNEGVATQTRDIIKQGILQGYVLDSYSGRKLGMQTTGNAGGVHNLTIDTGTKDLDELCSHMNEGLLVTELIGFGVNTLTGDYSRGAAGFWVENGEIQYPVEEVTIAGNLKDMFMHIAEVGNDVDTRGNVRTGSILIENMTIAGE